MKTTLTFDMDDLLRIAAHMVAEDNDSPIVAFSIKNLFKGLTDSNLKDELNGIYKHLSKMEELFIDARDATDDPVKKAILTGMYSDWINFKSEKWKEYMYMLES